MNDIERFFKNCIVLKNDIEHLFEIHSSSDKEKIAVMVTIIIVIVKQQKNQEVSFNQLINILNKMFEEK